MGGNEVRADPCSDRRITLQFQGAGAHLWVLERRNGHARRIYNRLVAGGRLSGNRNPAEVQWRLSALIAEGWFSACRLLFGSNLVDLPRRGEKDEGTSFPQVASQSGQFAQ